MDIDVTFAARSLAAGRLSPPPVLGRSGGNTRHTRDERS